MTNYERITQSPEALADQLIECDKRELSVDYCKDLEECWDRVGELDTNKCRQCLIEWLTRSAENVSQITRNGGGANG